MKDINSVLLHRWPMRFVQLKQHRWVSDEYTQTQHKHKKITQVQVCRPFIHNQTHKSLFSSDVCTHKTHDWATSCWISCLISPINELSWQTNKSVQLILEIMSAGEICIEIIKLISPVPTATYRNTAMWLTTLLSTFFSSWSASVFLFRCVLSIMSYFVFFLFTQSSCLISTVK